ncbi:MULTISPECIES: metallophosphoesterase [Serratia]|uniref:metallophosphoesterase n=1 Tax=Serratia TaxID=613 RepID=UPI00069B5992|nr:MULTISPECIES: metallophosphoesterase [Serratia]MBE4974803.1 metallophosphoesterase [Serratia sp. X3]MCH6194089.1 metallophosphoesterase [Serratia sp. X10]MDI3198188.1 metallophosphoesterase [Serratia ureilytica]UUW18850.1 metallophosphoesterase [Serratia ureilytica]
MITELAKNEQGRDFAVGDLHGCLDELRVLLEHVGFDTRRDRLVAVGDLIDRGTNSLGCLTLLEQPWFFSVLGNHEKVLLDYRQATESQRQSEIAQRWKMMGGDWFFELDDAMRYRCQQLAMMLPWVIKLTVAQVDYCVIHAEVPPEIDCLETFLTGLKSGDPVSTHSCLFGRRRNRAKYDGPIMDVGYVLCGHTPGEGARQLGNMCNLDYGAFDIANHGALCLLELGTHRRYLLRKDGIVEQAFDAA